MRPSLKAFSNIGGFMEQAQELLKVYQDIEKHIHFLESNIISVEEDEEENEK